MVTRVRRQDSNCEFRSDRDGANAFAPEVRLNESHFGSILSSLAGRSIDLIEAGERCVTFVTTE